MQFLYMNDCNSAGDVAQSVRHFIETQDKKRDYYAFAEALIFGVIEHKDEIDETINKNTQNWTFERIAKVELAILRLAIFELQHRLDIPPIVIINEAIDLGKEFAEPDSRRFINGVLDRLKANLNRPDRTPVTE